MTTFEDSNSNRAVMHDLRSHVQEFHDLSMQSADLDSFCGANRTPVAGQK